MVVCAAAMTASFKLFLNLGKGLGRNLSFLTCFTIFAFLHGRQDVTQPNPFLILRQCNQACGCLGVMIWAKSAAVAWLGKGKNYRSMDL